MGIITLGSEDFIRVPLPAARMTMSNAFMVIVYRLPVNETRISSKSIGALPGFIDRLARKL